MDCQIDTFENMHDNFLHQKLQERQAADAFRKLSTGDGKIDFCSNDYLGIVREGLIEMRLSSHLSHGSTGSRLLSGNNKITEEAEVLIAGFHNSSAALIYNSGYDANTGLLSCLPQKDDLILYDQLSHASIRDGIRLSFAKSISFRHNDLNDLEAKLKGNQAKIIFIVTESVFSMDGDMAPLRKMTALAKKHDAALIVDEAHATGVIGAQGVGLVQHLGLEEEVFARIHTFGKACGVHGAAILGTNTLKDYLINFSRQFIYSTALPPASVSAIRLSYQIFPGMDTKREHLNQLITTFQQTELPFQKLESHTPIQVVVIPGNTVCRKAAQYLQQQQLDVRPILYPTVPMGTERLRIVLHAFNTKEDVEKLVKSIQEANKIIKA